MKTITIFFTTVLCFVLISVQGFAEQYYVSKQGNNANDGTSWATAFQTIRTATGKSVSGDSIWVATGTYTEGYVVGVKSGVKLYGGFSGNETSLDDRDTSNNKCIIDGNKSYYCVSVYGMLDGFHITNGMNPGTSLSANGGGLIIRATGTVNNCKIYSNSSVTSGGGVYALSGSVMTNSEVYSNTAANEGGGVLSLGSISNCRIYSNSSKFGGGIKVESGSTITNCDIYSNTSAEHGGGAYNAGTITESRLYSNISNSTSGVEGERGGGGICNKGGTISNSKIYQNSANIFSGGIVSKGGIVTNCQIYSNTAQYHGGGGIYGDIKNCIIHSNSSQATGGIYIQDGDMTNCIIHSNTGGGIYMHYSSLTNCIIYGNTGGTEYGGVGYATGVICNSIIWNNYPTDYPYGEAYNSCFGEADGTNGNIKANPMFTNTTGDLSKLNFHLKNGSPCVDTGTNTSPHSWVKIPTDDLAGYPRPGGDGKIDMGAYESADFYLPADPSYKFLYVSKNGNNSDGTSWANAFTSITDAINNAKGDNLYRILIAAGTYMEQNTLEVHPRCFLMGGYDGTETSPEDRDFLNRKAIIDGEKSYRCITNYGELDGIYITNGLPSSAGSAVYNKSGAVIRNSTIYGNSIEMYKGAIYNYGIITNSLIHSNSGHYAIINSRVSQYYDYGGITKNSKIFGNSSGIWNYTKGKTLNCLVYSNRYTGIDNSGIVSNSIVYSNSGIGIENSGTVINTISWKNEQGDIDSNSSVSYSCYNESEGTNGNIRQNPLFNNTSGEISTWDFRLQNGSMCIDAGTNGTNVPAVDFDGNPRPGNDTKTDMGAFESPDEYLPGNPPPHRIVYISKNGNNTDGASWINAYNSISKAIDAGSDEFCDFYIAEGIYSEGKTLAIPGIYSLFGGYSDKLNGQSKRDILNNKTIIDGEYKYLPVNNSGNLNGLYITGGNAGGVINQKSAQIDNCTIYKNCYTAGTGSSFGGIENFGSVANSLIYSNTADNYGALYNEGKLINTVIHSNSTSKGSTIYNENYDDGLITNCVIYSNTASSTGGIYLRYGNTYNNIIWNNTPSDIGGYTDYAYNSCFKEAVAGDQNNTNQNPMFVNSSGDPSTWDFHLQQGSPCIDTGEASVAPLTDKSGAARPQGAGVDMGVYEYLIPSSGDVDMNGKIDFNDAGLIQAHINNLITLSTQQQGLGDHNHDGKIDIADIVSIINSISKKQ